MQHIHRHVQKTGQLEPEKQRKKHHLQLSWSWLCVVWLLAGSMLLEVSMVGVWLRTSDACMYAKVGIDWMGRWIGIDWNGCVVGTPGCWFAFRFSG